MKLSAQYLLAAAASGAVMGLTGCTGLNAHDQLTVVMISGLQTSGTIQPFRELNTEVIAHHPGSEVAHAALDKDGDHYLYQATLIDPYKMQWYVEIDAKTGAAVTDRQE